MINCVFENGNKASLRHIVVHAILEKEGKLLLEKRAKNLLEGGKWGLPAGFLERDETAERGVLRELKEETGWEGKVISLFKINTNPNRPHEDRQNVVLDFIVEPIIQLAGHDDESSEVEWFPLDSLPSFEKLAFDHGETIKLYLEYRKKEFSLPLLV